MSSDFAADLDLEAPESYNLAWDIDRFADGDGDGSNAVYWEDEAGNTRVLTYQELRRYSNQLANALKEKGLQKGDRIIIVLPRIPETYIAFLAAMKLELIISPGSDMLMPKDLVFRLNHSEAKAIICYHAITDRVDAIRSETKHLQHLITVGGEVEGWTDYEEMIDGMPAAFEPGSTRSDDMAFLCYTSGTTGQPKGAMLSHGWVYAHRELSRRIGIDNKPGDRIWSTVSPAWVKWLHNSFINTLGNGASGFAYMGHMTGEKYLRLIEKYGINFLCAAATEFRIMAGVDQLERFKLPSLKHAVSAGEPLGYQVMDSFRRHFDVQIGETYGQTESSGIITSFKHSDAKPGAMGKSTLGDRVRVVDANGETLPAGGVGIIALHRSLPLLFKGYYNDPERTEKAYLGDWFMTGDLAKIDEDGYFWFEGRSDDVIISAGYTIDPFEVEEALLSHQAVKECAVVASPDPVRGAIVKAFVVLEDRVTDLPEDLAQVLQSHAKAITAPYKYPREIEFTPELPKTISGKIRRAALRELEKQRKANPV